ncbi:MULTISPECIES: hypothetical protein [Campylobacter]|uniref:Uncharacterized protein n=1 Tax=Campylobacter vicugnae TaxID=1660076 RepID=A0ABZ2E6G3_9BACT|nr:MULTISPECIES: hypothetical protein [unclassified Campylobacter]MCR8701030.1 hypothetical protein [Campylobacter sp. RM12176]
MKKGILVKLGIILDPLVHAAEIMATKAKDLRDTVVEDTIVNHSKKDTKITDQMVQEYIHHSKRMDDMMDKIFNR